jgi:D-threo-aldose 1-dehydrogenase
MTVTPDSADWMRPLGATGLTVSAVTVGGAPLGSMPQNFGYEVAEQDAVTLVREVLASPLRTIDTSNGYSGGESERRIGLGIAEYAAEQGGVPQDLLVITKVDARDGDYSGERVRASVAESSERLGISPLPLVHLHDPEFHDFDAMTAPGGAVDTLVRLREEGVIGHIGLAGGDVHELARYLELGVFEALLVHNRWTLVDHSAQALIRDARDRGIAVVNAAIYGGGILANPRGGSTTYGYRAAAPETLAAIAAMDDLARRHGTDLATVALQASLRDPLVDTTVVGFSKPERIEAIVRSTRVELPDAFWDELDALRPPPRVWLDALA